MSVRAETCFLRLDGDLRRIVLADTEGEARGVLVTLHGLGEHVGKYVDLHQMALARGFHVAAYDQRGHGRTPGRRGDFLFADLVADLDAFLAFVRERHPDAPVFLLAHSLGALVAIDVATRPAPRLAGLVLTSPALALAREPSDLYGKVVRGLARVLPRLPLPRGSDPRRLTGDPERIRAWREDPLIHRVVTPRAMVSTAAAMERIRAGGLDLDVPLLVLVAGEDAVVDGDRALAWARRLEGEDVTVERVTGARHEILNDVGRREAAERILAWCEARTASVP